MLSEIPRILALHAERKMLLLRTTVRCPWDGSACQRTFQGSGLSPRPLRQEFRGRHPVAKKRALAGLGRAISQVPLSCQNPFCVDPGGGSRRRVPVKTGALRGNELLFRLPMPELCQNSIYSSLGSCCLSESSFPKLLISGTSVWSEWRH